MYTGPSVKSPAVQTYTLVQLSHSHTCTYKRIEEVEEEEEEEETSEKEYKESE